ncbi:hypothetical protein KDM92_18365, partial [Undibacterium sp. BYS107W]|nr:hypothetical protein [Undibacterium baiyunense]
VRGNGRGPLWGVCRSEGRAWLGFANRCPDRCPCLHPSRHRRPVHCCARAPHGDPATSTAKGVRNALTRQRCRTGAIGG